MEEEKESSISADVLQSAFLQVMCNSSHQGRF